MTKPAALLTLALACPAGAFELAFPAECRLGETCYIQQTPDHDPGPGAADFTCGPLSYDGHDGTDIALPTRAAMAAGVAVLAAAPGVVTGARDGVADFAPETPGKECGNGVVIDHGQGWETQYCHLRQGSLRVTTGDRVETGTPLGQIGQSGQAAFPHLHLTLRHKGRSLDPFAPGATACGAAGDDLWAEEVPLRPGGLLDIGIHDGLPDYDSIKTGLPSPDLPMTAPALVVWAYGFGLRAGDTLVLRLNGPDGPVVSERIEIDRPQALGFRAAGRKGRGGWPAGPYTATATLIRAGQEIDRQSLSLSILP